MRVRSRRDAAAWAAWSYLLVLACFSYGCGAGGDDPCLSLTPAFAPSAGAVVVRSGAGSGCQLQKVEVLATNLTDLFSGSFTAIYDPATVRYEGYATNGSVLAGDGATLRVLVTEQENRVTVGVSRISSDHGVAVSGTQRILVLLFSRKGGVDESGALYFEDAALLGSETPPQVKPGISWYGGVFQVR